MTIHQRFFFSIFGDGHPDDDDSGNGGEYSRFERRWYYRHPPISNERHSVMDKHLSILAKEHIETRFVKIQVEKSPLLAESPTLAFIKNTKVGFNELGGKDDFSTEDLEERLARAQVIHYDGESSLKLKSTTQTKKSARQSAYSDADSEYNSSFLAHDPLGNE